MVFDSMKIINATEKLHVEKLVTLPAVTKDINEMLSSVILQERAENWKCLLKMRSKTKTPRV